ncbi:AbiV family abortive infection protein [Shewanella donghaensis]|uniref:AbiV family abortive infection protein n=1 Tax=Shewanella donghaensis TaxID=238836 RepID=UPI0011834094|nr:AbiV family abortive infection protein [Shewanella donghaensis]
MNKVSGLSKYKFEKISIESQKNSLRLLSDAILLYENESFPSSFQLSVLSLEEFSKAKWVEHYYFTALTNDGFPAIDIEQDWLKLLFNHPKKQMNFVSRELFEYSPKFFQMIQSKELEVKKQRAVYVGLSRHKGKIDTGSRISIPTKAITQADAKKLISLMVSEFKNIEEKIEEQDIFWDIPEMDLIIKEPLFSSLKTWNHKSGIKGKRWYPAWKNG